jgi:RNA polymerase sigma-70 factor, ECF subfamily
MIDIDIGDRNKWLRDEQRWSEWMSLTHQGDSDTYQKLLGELAVVIEKYLIVRFGPSNWLEDMVQECLLAIHKGRHTYHPDRPFRPWLFAIVRNKSIDMLRSNQLYKRRLQSVQPVEGLPASYQPDYINNLNLARILDTLKPDQREALTLTKYVGYTVAEAALWSGVSKTAMKLRVFRAVNEVRKKLAEENIE